MAALRTLSAAEVAAFYRVRSWMLMLPLPFPAPQQQGWPANALLRCCRHVAAAGALHGCRTLQPGRSACSWPSCSCRLLDSVGHPGCTCSHAPAVLCTLCPCRNTCWIPPPVVSSACTSRGTAPSVRRLTQPQRAPVQPPPLPKALALRQRKERRSRRRRRADRRRAQLRQNFHHRSQRWSALLPKTCGHGSGGRPCTAPPAEPTAADCWQSVSVDTHLTASQKCLPALCQRARCSSQSRSRIRAKHALLRRRSVKAAASKAASTACQLAARSSVHMLVPL